MGEGVNVDRVRGVIPCLNLLYHFLRVGRGEHTNDASGLERLREVVKEGGDSVGETSGCEDARAEQRVPTEGVKEGIFGAG